MAMTTGAINATTATGTSTNPTSKNGSLNQADFLKIFVTQLKFQDPLQPMDNAQMASQMAQFSMVQSLNSMSESFKGMESSQAAVNNLQAASLVGKKVEVKGNILALSQGTASEGSYQLDKPGKVTIKILDDKGSLVRVIESGVTDTQKQKIIWDGKNQQGIALPDGKYSFQVTAVDEQGTAIEAKTTMVGKVDGVTFDQGSAYLQIGANKVLLSDIIAIRA
jgi:flagellar basal-body rod modification protein FlgD